MRTDKIWELRTTNDGSHTLHSDKYDADYHSKHGAIKESKHVFIKEGLKHYVDTHNVDTVRIFETGFGTGLNAFLAFLFSEKENLNICYNTIETNPVPYSLADDLNYAKILDYTYESKFLILHEIDWNIGEQVGHFFHLRKCNKSLREFIPHDLCNIIFHDAFGPGVQPEMWDMEACQKLYDILEVGGILVTFCAQGAFKRNLQALGFEVESIPGPPGKREMTRATKVK